MTDPTLLRVDVVYALPEQTFSVSLQLPQGATIADALELARDQIPVLQPAQTSDLAVGIFGQSCTPDQVLKNEDRVEIYRPLQMDAKQARRKRAREQ